MQPNFIPLPFSYKKDGSDVWVFNTSSLPVPSRKIKDQQMIVLGPGFAGGNHRHPRTEWFIALSAGLEIYWLDDKGELQSARMFSENEELMLVEVPPMLPHAVKNTHQSEKAILVEFADAKMSDVERVEVI